MNASEIDPFLGRDPAPPRDPKTMRHIGIDVGTTNTSLCTTGYNSTLAQFEKPEATRLDGRDFLRSAILLDGDGAPLAYGRQAYSHPAYQANPERLREEFKLRLGDEASDAEPLVTYLVAEVARQARRHLGLVAFDEEEYQTTVGVPARWARNEYFRVEAMLRAVSATGLPNVAAVIEPVAAMYFHTHLGQLAFEDYPQLWLVIDIGGGTTDLAIVETQPGGALPVVRHTDGLRFGGRDFDRVILEYLVRSCRPEGPALSPTELIELTTVARDFKEDFSKRLAKGQDDYTANVTIGGRRHEIRLTRAEFESTALAGPLIARLDGLLRHIFLRAGRPHTAIDRVILTGGSARWYFVRRAADRFFGRDVCLISNEPELAIAKGLALARTGFAAPTREVAAHLVAQIVAAVPAPPNAETIELSSIVTQPLDLADCRRRAQRMVNEKALMAGGVALVLSPIPGVSQIPLTSIEAKMVYDVALVYGYKLDEKQIVTIVGSLLAGGTIAKIAVMETATFIPVVGTVVKTAVGGSAAYGFGRLAIEYFEKRRRADQQGITP